MTLYSTIQKRMQESLEDVQAKFAAKNAEVEAELRQELGEKQRMGTEMVDNVITERVHMETYKLKQDAYFDKVKQGSDSIEQAYRNVLPKLLSHKLFTEQVRQFLTGVDSSVEVQVSGQYANECKDALQAAGHSTVSVVDGEGLGTMRYKTDVRSGELSLEDFLNDVKKRTIQFVSNAVNNA
jgi:hypothetical protein